VKYNLLQSKHYAMILCLLLVCCLFSCEQDDEINNINSDITLENILEDVPFDVRSSASASL